MMRIPALSTLFILAAFLKADAQTDFSAFNGYKYVIVNHRSLAESTLNGRPNGNTNGDQNAEDSVIVTLQNWFRAHGAYVFNDVNEVLQNGGTKNDIAFINYHFDYDFLAFNLTGRVKLWLQDCNDQTKYMETATKKIKIFSELGSKSKNQYKLFTLPLISFLDEHNSYYYIYNGPTANTGPKNSASSGQSKNPVNSDPINPPVNSTAGEPRSKASQNTVLATTPSSDVDINIPLCGTLKPNRYALIIGNEDYSTYQEGLSSEANVDYATHDALVFKEYAVKTLGIPEENIILITNATERTMNRSIDKLSLLAKATGGDGELFFYYAGHGYPDELTKEAYIIPVDVSGAEIKYALKLKDVYAKLSEYHTKKVVCFLDACFSGGARSLSLMASRGIKIKPKEDVLSGNMVVYSAVSNDESSLPYKDKAHGMFTYYLLKKLQDTKGDTSFGELSDYLAKQVSVKSIMVNSKEQTPTMIISPDLGESWRNWKLK